MLEKSCETWLGESWEHVGTKRGKQLRNSWEKVWKELGKDREKVDKQLGNGWEQVGN